MSSKELILSETFRLSDLPSFISGMASVLDIGSTLTDFNDSVDEDEADYKATQSDWRAVGKDLKRAMSTWEGKVTA